MNKKFKILALVLAIIMLVGAMPLSLLAADATSEAESATTALDALSKEAKGSLYEPISIEDIAEYLGTSATSATGANGALIADGHFGVRENGSVGCIEDAKTLAGGGTLNKYGQALVFADGEAQFIDVPQASDITVTYVNGSVSIPSGTKYITFSLSVKRGEAMATGYFARFRFGAYTDEATGKSITPEMWVANYRGNGNLALSSKAGATVPFSTSLFTTITAVYNIENDTLTTYANGIPVETVANATGGVVQKYNITSLRDISWWYGNRTHTGRYCSFDKVRACFINDDATLAKCVVEDTTPANGVFKIDGDYYLFENNFPVLNATRTIGDYTIKTEADTGKIIKCYKPVDNSMYYKRWETADYAAAGITLAKNGYSINFSNQCDAYVGYNYTTVTEEGTTYYIVEPATSTIQNYHNVGTDVGDGYEFSLKRKVPSSQYYSKIPTDATEIKDAAGNVTGYKTATAPDKSVYPDLSWYFGISQGSFVTDASNINFRLKAGDGLNFNDNFVRYRYFINRSTSNIDAHLGKTEMINGLPHLKMSDIDCGILRTDMYTDFTIRTYIADNTLYYDLYVNGVCLATKITIREGVQSYQHNALGVWLGTNRAWSEPMVTWGTIQVYNGDKVNNNENPLNATVTAANGTYTYENGIAVDYQENVVAEDTVGLRSYSVSLGEKLGINFYAALPKSAAKAVITVDGVDQTVNLSSLSATSDGTYKISSKISSVNVAEQIKLAIYDKDGKPLTILTDNEKYEGCYITSVKNYAKTIASNEKLYGKENVEAVKAMLSYAAYAEKYFGGNASLSTAYSNADTVAVKNVTASDIKGTVSAVGENPSDILGSLQLVLDNATKIRINLKGAATVTSEYSNVTYVEGDGKYYVDICEIDAKNLDTVYTLNVNGINVSINVLGVASIVANDADTYGEDFVNLMKALYLYSKAADALA